MDGRSLGWALESQEEASHFDQIDRGLSMREQEHTFTGIKADGSSH